MSPIWQLGHVGKEPDVFAKPPYYLCFYNSAITKTSRACSHRGRNGFSPYKKGSCSITQLLSQPMVSQSRTISQEPVLYSVRTLTTSLPQEPPSPPGGDAQLTPCRSPDFCGGVSLDPGAAGPTLNPEAGNTLPATQQPASCCPVVLLRRPIGSALGCFCVAPTTPRPPLRVVGVMQIQPNTNPMG